MNCWKTIPTSRLISRRARSSLTLRPSTTTSPSWKSSRRLMVRMRVLFPEPEGPMMTSFSPGATLEVDPLEHVQGPNHLCRLRIRMMGSTSGYFRTRWTR